MRETYGNRAPAGLKEARRTPPCRPADARRAVRQAVAERRDARVVPCDDTALEDALLVTSELTTNAILHGGGITGFDVDVDPGTVSVTVCDRSDDVPVVHDPVDESGRSRLGGRGWPIVCRLARDVSVAGLPRGGKRITAVIPLG
ncbi:ATP-binding protein [Streptomyces collinus]|uniref:ATPase n=1 Tax=Streptomyces collinus (strain DSM 40733 / Tue 365) TaxID=1214242 RepID=S5UL80_STRC3|nr:ATP-binding protein [Streptomyces collinus]AGS67668.1 ATPase [Streptomyces collinus Tu 365]UJA06354.1 ATPase [Streptomyces collinus]UJA12476.1 ATPase [Streptomyces collinus]